MENQISTFEWYKQHALEIKRERNFIVGVERIKRFTVFTNEFNDINVTLIVFEHAQLGDGTIGRFNSRRNGISKVTEQEKTVLIEVKK